MGRMLLRALHAGVQLLSGQADRCRLVLSDASGEALLEQAANAGVNTLDLAWVKNGKTPACIKLLHGRDLVDLAGASRRLT